MRFFIFACIGLIWGSLGIAQPREDKKTLFEEGIYFLNRGDYSEAAYYFRILRDTEPENSNFNYKLGECYMQMPGSEHMAVPCFEKAVQHVVEKKKYDIKDINEKSAPLHAWFYLGNVYRMVGRLDEALKAYDVFVRSPYYYGNYNLSVVENEIKSCERAKIIMDSPIDATIEPLDSIINTLASEIHPVLSGDESTLIFVRKLKFYDAILFVQKVGNGWSTITNLNPQIGSDGEFYPVSLSYNGQSLYLVKNNAGGDKDLYVSHKKGDVWTKAESLGKHINTLSDESWAAVSDDNKTLWFTSSRSGGMGGLDIYFSQKDKNGQWGKPKNAGKSINTQYDEESPCLCQQGQILFFSSRGHYSMGGYDIFYSTRSGKSWKEPVNIGFPINNTSDNTGFIPMKDCKSGYYSKVHTQDGSASEDIYKVILKSNHPQP
jgi:tetratricopeptide (TPR) repeat protein